MGEEGKGVQGGDQGGRKGGSGASGKGRLERQRMLWELS